MKTLSARIERAHNLTNEIIEEGQQALAKYQNLTREYYDQV